MYAAGRPHRLRDPCRSLLGRIVREGLPATTSAEVIQEILHRFTARREPELGADMARHTLDIFAPVLPITHPVMARMPALVVRYPELSARDLVHVATCLEEGLRFLVSPDAGFDTVTEVVRIAPDDEAALAEALQ